MTEDCSLDRGLVLVCLAIEGPFSEDSRRLAAHVTTDGTSQAFLPDQKQTFSELLQALALGLGHNVLLIEASCVHPHFLTFVSISFCQARQSLAR